MKNLSLFMLLTCFPIASMAQQKQLSIFSGYPIPFGNNFVNKAVNYTPSGTSEGYKSIFNVGMEGTITTKSNFVLGASFQWSRLSLNDTNVMDLQGPKFLLGYQISTRYLLITPNIGVGYQQLRFGTKLSVSQEYSQPIIMYAASLNTGVRVSLKSGKALAPFMEVNCMFNKLTHPEGTQYLNIPYNRNVFLFYPELGISWTYKNKKSGAKEKLPTI